MLYDWGLSGKEEWGALIGFPGIIASMIFSGNIHAFRWQVFVPVNFLIDVGILLGFRWVIGGFRRDA
jgi:hypothetical protein